MIQGDREKRINTRDSSIELYRILAMLLIVAHHYVVNSGLTAPDGPIYADPSSWRSMYLIMLGAWGKTGINCFVLITGYFMCKSDITARKFMKLLLEVMFYKITIGAVFWISGYEPFSAGSFIKTVLPVSSISTGFISAFLVFYLLIPFLNILIRNIEEKQHTGLLVICGFIYVLMGTVPGFTVTMNYVSWFIVLYFISSYIRLYPKAIYEKKTLWWWLTLASFALSALSVVVLMKTRGQTGGVSPYSLISDSNKILAVTNGVCSFMAFKNLNMKHNRLINTVASSTLGVLLIHASSDAMRRWLWTDTIDCVGHYGSAHLVAYSLGSVLLVFTVCALIDQVRIRLLEEPFFRWADKRRSIKNC